MEECSGGRVKSFCHLSLQNEQSSLWEREREFAICLLALLIWDYQFTKKKKIPPNFAMTNSIMLTAARQLLLIFCLPAAVSGLHWGEHEMAFSFCSFLSSFPGESTKTPFWLRSDAAAARPRGPVSRCQFESLLFSLQNKKVWSSGSLALSQKKNIYTYPPTKELVGQRENRRSRAIKKEAGWRCREGVQSFDFQMLNDIISRI